MKRKTSRPDEFGVANSRGGRLDLYVDDLGAGRKDGIERGITGLSLFAIFVTKIC